MQYETNDKGFVMFSSRDWGYTGDRGTWARVDKETITIKRAAKGIISEAYEAEMNAFCRHLGVDFAAIRCGETVNKRRSE